MQKKDYYTVLGISREASKKEIKKAYKKLAVKYHPDKNQENINTEERFKEVKEAYEVLSDEEKRKQYDQFGHAAFSNDNNGHQRPGGNQAQHSTHGFEDVFGGAFRQHSPHSGYEEFGGFDDLFSHARRQQTRPQKGQDLEFVLTVDFADTINGAKKMVELTINGVQKKINVKIPAGIKEGEKIRFAGKGGAGLNGGSLGDILITIKSRPHPSLRRDGDDLHCSVHISMTTAALGGKTDVHVLERRYKLKIPAGTQGGSILKMKGKGVVNRNGNIGNLLVTIKVDTPTNLTESQKDLLEQFRTAH
ncbi:DnaJ C-terminal domain-containing protein [Vibrio genomosp. F10]|uniref:DnaJ C-terminal domain-containing protein n=1 Tax=Vibrio genomosp. F10 TaxID=723171 RepID=UPI0002FA6C6F|nr:DnaJ C-terminal domain-containing protein [Vibrio genomosp. F10]OEF08675.1 molecular chaperone DnaJ [Vibrio genomosp. F10 str. 9ZB36]